MIDITLLYSILALSAISWLWIYSTPTIKLKTYLKSKIRILNGNWIEELIECLTCSAFWISFFSLLLLQYPILITISGAAITSVFITLIDSHIKFK
jgi:hypothetical protein